MRNKVDKENNLENNNQGEESTKEIKIFCKTIHGIYIKKEGVFNILIFIF